MYIFAKKINGTEESGIIQTTNPPKVICLCPEENSKIILTALNQQKDLELLDWVASSPYIVVECQGKRAWVNSHDHIIYRNGSEHHYLKLITEHGITSGELIKRFNFRNDVFSEIKG